MKMNKRYKFGLIGKNISYSFSKKYFTEKFEKLGLNTFKYHNYDLPEIEEFPFILYQREDDFIGFNVTIPYKESIIKYLDEVEEEAQIIGAVNTIKVTPENKLIGYNTDVYGFQKSIKPILKQHHKKALILGTGGASKAISYALNKLEIENKFVSRKELENNFLYSDLNENIMAKHTVIINCTPLGTSPNIEDLPDIPYKYITNKHLLFDLIYNPAETKFLKEGKKRGAIIKNGYEMLELQAEKSWEIWNS
ncbi:shikimate dehydrogenase [Lutibacter profundi]|uniref:Shikimate dehydrogenase n=1 Tax=Lutibacter profundi TaxID=1622118 RepID=A0A109RN75_9FLAO|nr:shikimate dehydrogenase [Lutibacter profundi]AMC10584.1 shikimate dehydrogenase [Lutibacter profundi]